MPDTDTHSRVSRSRWTTLCGLSVAVIAGLAMLSCQGGIPLSPSAAALAGTPAELTYCAEKINHYRSSVGLPPLQQSDALEAFAAEAAQNDGLVHVAHHYFTRTNGGGTAKAETEILWWRGFAVRAVIQKGLAQMWDAGPPGEHYEIIVGPYTQIGCGIFVNGSEVTVTQEFR